MSAFSLSRSWLLLLPVRHRCRPSSSRRLFSSETPPAESFASRIAAEAAGHTTTGSALPHQPIIGTGSSNPAGPSMNPAPRSDNSGTVIARDTNSGDSHGGGDGGVEQPHLVRDGTVVGAADRYPGIGNHSISATTSSARPSVRVRRPTPSSAFGHAQRSDASM